MSVIDVRIAMVNGGFVSSPDVAKLSKSKGETIKWHNDTTEAIRLDFNGRSPFAAGRYDLAAGKQANSGAVTANDGTSWFYTITAASGAMADPQVIIEK